LLLARGASISGHDIAASPFSKALEALGVELCIGTSSAELLPPDADLVVHSAAVDHHDPQLVLARERGIETLKYGALLGRLAPPSCSLAVAGTHGKTTTSWMLHYALRGLESLGMQASGCLIGGTDRSLATNAVAPATNGWFVAEACEYDRSFLQLRPFGAILTNVEADHLDYYKDLDELEHAFARFAGAIHRNGLLVVGADVPERITSQASCRVWREGREFHIDRRGEESGAWRFRLRGPGWATPELTLEVPGEFNAHNAALALALALGLVAPAEGFDARRVAPRVSTHLACFAGVERRFEPWIPQGDAIVIHDYAHHPTEIAVTLEAARRAYPGRSLQVLFQPHQHSRTARFLNDFVESLRGADRVVVADVYGARTHIDVHSAGAPELVDLLRKAHVEAEAGGGLATVVPAFTSGLTRPCVALVLGAGDIDGIQQELCDELAVCGASAREPG